MYGGNGGGGGGREFYPPDLGHQLRHAAAAAAASSPPLPALEHVVLLRPPAAPLSEECPLFDGLNGRWQATSQSFPIQRYRNFATRNSLNLVENTTARPGSSEED